MRLRGIGARNFLSLRDFDMRGLDESINFIVGPNGSGKTTVFRAIRACRDSIVRFAESGAVTDLTKFRSRGVASDDVEIWLDVDFDGPHERELIRAFVIAGLCHTGDLQQYNLGIAQVLPDVNPSSVNPLVSVPNTVSADATSAFARWLDEQVSAEELAFMFSGRLSIRYHHEFTGSIRIAYSFTVNGNSLHIVAGTPNFADGVLYKGKLPKTLSSGSSGSAAGVLLRRMVRSAAGQDIADGGTKESGLPNTYVHSEALRTFLDGDTTSYQPPFDILSLFDELAAGNAAFHIQGTGNWSSHPAHKYLSDLTGRSLFQMGESYPFSLLLSQLIAGAFVFTNNLRVPFDASYQFPLKTLVQNAVDSNVWDDELQLLAYLFRLKNGAYEARRQFEAIQQTFRQFAGDDLTFDLAIDTIDTGEDNTPRQHIDETISIDVNVVSADGETSLAYHGAGIWEALILATLLEARSTHNLLLDEPASNLHPTMQHRLLNMLTTSSTTHGTGQVIITTHSQHLMPTKVQDFRKVHRLTIKNGISQLHSLDARFFQHRPEEERLEQELGTSSDVGGLLFARGVMLVEGGTEAEAISIWFPGTEAAAGRQLADYEFALYPVHGKENFRLYIRLLHAFGIPWTMICDGDALDCSQSTLMWRGLVEAKLIPAVPPSAPILPFEQARKLAESAGVYTANTDYDQDFEDVPAVSNYLAGLARGKKSKIRSGMQLARVLACPPEMELALRKAMECLDERLK